MKIALVSPKGPLYRHRGGIFKKNLRYAPLTLTTLAALVPAELNAEVKIYDEGVEDIDPERIEADLVGITIITGNSIRAYTLADVFRARGLPVVVGGPHVTLIPEDSQPHADSVVVGYAEDTWPELLRNFAAGQMKPRYTMDPDLSLANRPFPKRELIKKHGYITTHVFEAIRSCVHSCEFCVAPVAWGIKPFFKPVEEVVADIKQHWGRRIIFIDLNLISDVDYASRLFEALIPLNVDWFGLTTTLLGRDKCLLNLAARSGCSGLLMGFESIMPGNLKQAKKGFNAPDEYRELVENLHRHKITLMACFTFGMDSDTPEVFMKTAKFAVDANIDLPRFAIVTPFPNTSLYNRLECEGRILTKNWELYDAQHVVFQPKQMSVEQLYAGHEQAWKFTYSVKSMFKRFLGSRIQVPVWWVTNLGYRFYSHHLSDFYNCDWIMGQMMPEKFSQTSPHLAPVMKLTFIHPRIGRRIGQPYIRSWQMEPLPTATLAGLTPRDVEVSFYDDRMEVIPYDKPSDLVAISIETYTARRAYQIASEYRRRGVPVIMGGFHATLCPEEVSRFAEAVVVGEAENVWEQVLSDAERGTLQTYYHSAKSVGQEFTHPNRAIYGKNRYLPIRLIEAGRGCNFQCDFCSIQAFFHNTQRFHPYDNIVKELTEMRRKPLVFFVDDNIIAHPEKAKEFLRQIIPLRIRWVSQASINVAYDEELLDLMGASGCQGILIGFESLNPENLKVMKKGVNLIQGDYENALSNLRRYNIRLYITFLFGYDGDTQNSFSETVRFAIQNRFYIAAFNHITPFPGTPLYQRLNTEGRLLYDAWWLEKSYRYNQVPFQPRNMTPEEVQMGCVQARREFYNWRNIAWRSLDPINRSTSLMWLSYFWINTMFRREVNIRNDYPLGDEAWQGQIILARQLPAPYPDLVTA